MLPKPLTEDICSLRGGVDRLAFSVLWEVDLVHNQDYHDDNKNNMDNTTNNNEMDMDNTTNDNNNNSNNNTAHMDSVIEVNIVNVRFTKSIIRSSAAMTYAEAQTRIDDTRLHDDITVGLRTMLAIARVLRAGRVARGALQLASPEVKFSIDQETHDPTDVSMYQVCVCGGCGVCGG